MIYSNTTRNDVKIANPNASFGETAQIISKNYKALSSEERAVWDEKASEDKERYLKEMAEYSKTKSFSTEVSSDDQASASLASSLPTQVLKEEAAKSSALKKKRKKPDASAASAKLFASFLKKKLKTA